MAFDPVSYAMGKKASGGGGGDITVEPLSVNSNGTYTAPSGKAYSPVTVNVPNSYSASDEGKVVDNGALVAQTSDTVTQNDTYDTTLINSLTVDVPVGANFSVKTATVSNGKSGTVDREFDNFIFLAELDTNDFPDSPPQNTALFLMFVYFNGGYITDNTKGFYTKSSSSGAWTLQSAAANWSSNAVGDTSITFSSYSTSVLQNGTWKILQVELPNTYPIYNLSKRIESIS